MSTHHQIDLIEFPAESAEDLGLAAEFYSDVFAWKFKNWGESYCDTQSSGVMSGINAVEEMRQQAPLAVIYSDDLEATMARVVEAGGKIVHDISSFPGGRRFQFRDPAGNELAVWSQ